VVLTSSDAPRDQENAEQHAAVHYFRKPISLGQFMQLGSIVKKVISHAQAE
jgi:CheY-like chemotaxis protein